MCNNNSPLVSVLMCVYNTNPEILKDAVSSILKQTHEKFELIIVDDKSDSFLYTDDIFLDKRITILRNNTNCGPSFSRNRALEIASGKYIAIMDSDDISYPQRLEKQVAFLEKNTDHIACGTWFKFIGDKSHEVKRIIPNNEYFRCCLLFDNSPTLLNSSMLIRKDVFDLTNLKWDERLRLGEDYFMWVQLLEHGKISNVEEVLVNYRVHKTQTTHFSNRSKIDANTWLIKEYQFKKIGLVFDKKYANLLSTKPKTKKMLLKLDKLLEQIIRANEKTKYFNEFELHKRCKEQINISVFSISSPFTLFALCFSKKFGYVTRKAIKYKICRLFGKGKKSNSYYCL